MSEINLDPVVKTFVDETERQGGKPLYDLTPAEARKVLADLQKDIVSDPKVQTDEYLVPLDHDRKMKVYIVKPKSEASSFPAVFYIHGGGWVMGGLDTHRYLIEQLALRLQCAVVFPEYELSPESQFPQTTDDLFTVLNYIAEYASNFDLNTTHLVVAGDSVGGNMAVVMALMAKERNLTPNIAFCLLLYPVADAAMDTVSYQKFSEGPWLSQKAMQWFWQQYAPKEQDRRNIYASILRAEEQQLAGLPPMLIITDENDVLRDEGEIFAQKLLAANVEAVSVRINGTIHDFLMLYALKDSPATKIAMSLIEAVLSEIIRSSDAEIK